MKISTPTTVAVTALLFSACASKESRNLQIVEARVEHNTTAFLLATQALDADSAGTFFSDSSNVVIASDGNMIHGAADFIAAMEEGFGAMAEQTFEPAPMWIKPLSATSAVVTANGVYHIRGTEGTTVEGVQAYTLLWQKIGDEWKITQAHFSTSASRVENPSN
jgi:ketosteroid isomerase-like protein